ncbi:MAG: UDP-N-acetylmuramoyl-tripeptide--D-alanyl-D-alanine ligase [Bacteroidia bacterium]|nr:UDP-N-acetylmuramoyl-tripeptide--D-alanyl-D-alanine ligase [Bacteroidia bacterium]
MIISDLYKLYLQYPSITTDTRNLTVNSIFFALKGANFNGNEFAQTALNKGCAFAVVDEKKFAADKNIILVDNVLATLQDLARIHRTHLSIPVIGITGTNGKTTTKELLGAVLAKKYNIHYTKGNLNNHIGVPLTILSITNKTEIAIIEMGANHPGEIKFLCEIAQPNFGLITNIGKAHLEGFGSMEGVIKTKSELYDHLKLNNGKIFANSDNIILTRLIGNRDYITYGRSAGAQCKAENISSNPFLEVTVSLNEMPTQTVAITTDKNIRIKSNLIGEYNCENLLAAVCAGYYFNVDAQKIKEAVEKYAPDNNRSQLLKTKHNTIFMDAYNANPTSMAASIENFLTMDATEKTFILGDMLELGEFSDEEHIGIINLLKKKNCSSVYLIGKSFVKAAENSGFKTFDQIDQFCEWIREHPIKSSSILIKGSRGIRVEKALAFL